MFRMRYWRVLIVQMYAWTNSLIFVSAILQLANTHPHPDPPVLNLGECRPCRLRAILILIPPQASISQLFMPMLHSLQI